MGHVTRHTTCKVVSNHSAHPFDAVIIRERRIALQQSTRGENAKLQLRFGPLLELHAFPLTQQCMHPRARTRSARFRVETAATSCRVLADVIYNGGTDGLAGQIKRQHTS